MTGVELLKRRYRAHGQPDAAEARRVVLALGMGKHIVVNTTAGRELHGNIVAIEPGYFLYCRISSQRRSRSPMAISSMCRRT